MWGPFSHEEAGYVIGPKGELKVTECFGPGTFHGWERRFNVWRTGCLMFNAISISALDSYRNLIYGYWTRYGPTVWLVLYQSDVRARMEHMERTRRTGMKLHAASAPTGEFIFDPTRPWEWCLRQVTNDHSFWRHELEEPALLVLSHAGRLSQMVDGDAPVRAASSTELALLSQRSAPSGAAQPQRSAPQSQKQSRSRQTGHPPRRQVVHGLPGGPLPARQEQRVLEGQRLRTPVREVPGAVARRRQLQPRSWPRAPPMLRQGQGQGRGRPEVAVLS